MSEVTMTSSENIQLDFPHYSSMLLDTLNKQRLEGKFCDLSVQVQDRIFRAHKTVLAASSPYFHDKLLLNNTNCLVLPTFIPPDAFENLLKLIYSGRLCLEMEALPSHLLVASGLQMWQVVDRCSELLKEKQACSLQVSSSRGSESQSPSSSFQSPPDEKLTTEVTVNFDDEDVIKVQVSEEEEEEEDDDDDDDDDEVQEIKNSGVSCSFDLPSSSSSGSPKVIYIKEEQIDKDDLLQLEVSDVQQEVQTEYHTELTFLVPPGSSPSSSDVSLNYPNKLYAEPESPTFSISKPLDLHGNEIVSHALQAQMIHAPIKFFAVPDGKKFGCLCGKRFAVKPKRDRHIMLTFSLRPFGCSVCNKKFKLKHHLTEHMKTHASYLYSCEDCGRKFRVESCYQKHKEVCKGQKWGGACWTVNPIQLQSPVDGTQMNGAL
ncbi:zinc finger and BTB domain-containing protein 9 [Hyperolius riggenbachi]|uniref:zinc finger and BTB domain-containing protein 9 n=1 Tax=Hyperolius riggenbachi TaxID=752182 RepID=UPI0035A3B5AF